MSPARRPPTFIPRYAWKLTLLAARYRLRFRFQPPIVYPEARGHSDTWSRCFLLCLTQSTISRRWLGFSVRFLIVSLEATHGPLHCRSVEAPWSYSTYSASSNASDGSWIRRKHLALSLVQTVHNLDNTILSLHRLDQISMVRHAVYGIGHSTEEIQVIPCWPFALDDICELDVVIVSVGRAVSQS